MVKNNDTNRANLSFVRTSQMSQQEKDKIVEAFFIQQYEESDVLFQNDWQEYLGDEE